MDTRTLTRREISLWHAWQPFLTKLKGKGKSSGPAKGIGKGQGQRKGYGKRKGGVATLTAPAAGRGRGQRHGKGEGKGQPKGNGNGKAGEATPTVFVQGKVGASGRLGQGQDPTQQLTS